MIQIQINIEEKTDEIQLDTNILRREDATKKEEVLAEMYGNMSVEFLQILQKSGIVEVIKAQVVKEPKPTNDGDED